MFGLLAGMAVLASGAAAQSTSLGPETNLPLPRFVSLKSGQANVRRGPGLSYPVNWVFLKKGMPLEIVAEYGHWRKIRDVDDAGGWVHFAMLRGQRTAVVTAEETDLHREPSNAAPLVAKAEMNVIFRLEACQVEWCEVTTGDRSGWVRKADIWGAAPDDLFE